VIATFSTASNFYRFIRLRQTGKNARGDDYLILRAFEVFGCVLGAPPFPDFFAFVVPALENTL
jgi:hypothetical protein